MYSSQQKKSNRISALVYEMVNGWKPEGGQRSENSVSITHLTHLKLRRIYVPSGWKLYSRDRTTLRRTFVVFLTEGRKNNFFWGKQMFFSEFFDPGIMFSVWRILQKEQRLSFCINLEVVNFQGRNLWNFWLEFWDKRWPHKFILNLTDL